MRKPRVDGTIQINEGQTEELDTERLDIISKWVDSKKEEELTIEDIYDMKLRQNKWIEPEVWSKERESRNEKGEIVQKIGPNRLSIQEMDVKNGKSMTYADDSQIRVSAATIEEDEEKMSKALKIMYDSMKEHRLAINESKQH